jgi:CBS domain-containing protein
VLREANILSLPVTGSKGSFSGCVSVTDILKALVTALKLERQRQSFDMKAEDGARAMQRIYSSPVTSVMHTGELWLIQDQNPTVMDAVKDMLQRRAVHHRLFTCNNLKDTAPTGILSQSDIVRVMWDHKVELGALLEQSVEDMGLCAVCRRGNIFAV